MSAGGSLAFVGDVHLDRDDPVLEEFLAFLDTLGRTAERVVLLGDLFNLWIGGRGMEQPHQTAVVARLADLRRRGVAVRYVEGNRDYRVGRFYTGTAMDDATCVGLVERFGGHSLYVAHGDLVNSRDLQYRSWRWLSRSPLFWAPFLLLPIGRRRRLADSLEARLRETNLEFKREFPEREVRQFAAGHFRKGHDVVVLGHFHTEYDLRGPAPSQRILVLPEWKGSRRHLEARPDGSLAFVDS